MMSIDEPQTERELLLDIRKDVQYLRQSHEQLETRIYGEDGTGGLCKEVADLKNQQIKWLGRDGAIVTGISGILTAAGLAIAFWR